MTGKAPNIRVTRAAESAPSHVGREAIDAGTLLALTTLGLTKKEARGALDAARENLDDDADLERVVRAALRHCPRPAGYSTTA